MNCAVVVAKLLKQALLGTPPQLSTYTHAEYTAERSSSDSEAVHLQALMAGKTPQAAMAAAVQHAQQSSADTAAPSKLAPLPIAPIPQSAQSGSTQDFAQPAGAYQPQPRRGRHGSLSPISRGGSTSPRHGRRAHRSVVSAPEPSYAHGTMPRDVEWSPRSLDEWREDPNNPQNNTYKCAFR